MRTPTYLALALSLALAGCPSGEESAATPSSTTVTKKQAPVAGQGTAPVVQVALSTDKELPERDACGGLLNSNNRCAPVTTLTAAIPGDVCLPEGIQEPNSASVEHLAWRTFVGLSWPVTKTGVADPAGPLSVAHGPDGPDSVWETWRTPRDLLQTARQQERALTSADWSVPAELPSECSADPGSMLLERVGKVSDAVHAILPDGAKGASGGPAIDQNGRPVLVETRMNRTLWDTVVSGGWYLPDSSPRGIQFPNNHGDTRYGVGAMAVQAAWVMIESVEEGDPSLHVREAYVYQEGNAARPAVCDKQLVQLVALQVGHKAGAGDDTWVWSVFENTAVMPVGSIEPGREYILRSAECTEPGQAICEGVTPGSAPAAAACCPNTDLHGRLGSEDRLTDDRIPTHLTRLDGWQDASGCTAEYRTALSGSPWANFVLVGAQWWGNYDAETLDFGPTPRTLRSLALEPFAVAHEEDGQDTKSSCIGCHSLGDDSVFFLSPMRLAVEVSSTDASPSGPTSAPE